MLALSVRHTGPGVQRRVSRDALPGRVRAACVPRAETQVTALARQAAVRFAAGLAAAAVVLAPGPGFAAPREAAAPLPPLPATLSTTFEYGGKMLFDPMAYSGRWYEVASLKRGFAGEGQQDCHCTQGIYVPQENPQGSIKLQVNTFCVHGGPTGRLSGIQGSVTCADPELLELLPEFKSEMDKMEGLVAKCALKFDSLPFIPAEPYIVIRTDYTTMALVRGATDRSFVQVYSRTPNPGPEFIAAQKAVLAELGYPADQIVDTPQDCPEMPPTAMMARMNEGMAGAELMPGTTPRAEAMRGYDLGEVAVTAEAPQGPSQEQFKGIQFDRLRNPLETLRNAVKLFASD